VPGRRFLTSVFGSLPGCLNVRVDSPPASRREALLLPSPKETRSMRGDEAFPFLSGLDLAARTDSAFLLVELSNAGR